MSYDNWKQRTPPSGKPLNLRSEHDCRKCGKNIPVTRIFADRGYKIIETSKGPYKQYFYECAACRKVATPCKYCNLTFDNNNMVYIAIGEDRHLCCQTCYPEVKLSIILTHY